jgi:hypothetical protein
MGACVDPAILPGAVRIVLDRAALSSFMEEVVMGLHHGWALRVIVNTLRSGPPQWLESLIDPDILYLITVVMIGVVLSISMFMLTRAR